MGSSPLGALVRDLAARLVPDRAGAALDATLEDILVDNGLGDDAPAWLIDFLGAIVTGRRVARTSFAREEMVGDRGDVTNALAELGALLPLGYEDYGEGITLDVKPLGVRAFVSREGPGGSYTYEVAPG